MESFFILFMFLFGLLITFIWMYIANRASLALDRLSRTRNVEVAEPFLRKNIVFSDDDFQTFLKDWNREIGFDPGEVIEAFMTWKIERHYRELRPEVLYEIPENVADPDAEDLEGLSVEELRDIVEHPADHMANTIEKAYRLLEKPPSER